MAMPCLIRVNTRAVYAKTEAVAGVEATFTSADWITVTDVQYSVEETPIDRSNVYTPTGAGLPPLPGPKRATFQITSYMTEIPSAGPTAWQLYDLFTACPVSIVDQGSNTEIQPSDGGCWGVDVKPCSIRIVEEGTGNVYRGIGCTGTFSLSADPGGQIVVVFSMTGEFVAPSDKTGFDPGIPNPLPVETAIYYRNALIQHGTGTDNDGDLVDPVALTTCPAFTFETGATAVSFGSACPPDGGGYSFVAQTSTATLSFNGVASTTDANQKLWSRSLSGDTFVVEAILSRTPAGVPKLTIGLLQAGIATPALGDTNGFVANTVTFNGGGSTPYTIIVGEKE